MCRCMNRWACLSLACVVLGSAVFIAVAQEQPTPEEMAEMMKAWAAVSTPGPQHERLTALAGEWEVASKMFMGGPDAPAMESKGHTSIKSVLGGRFIVEHHRGEIVMPDERGEMKPQPFEGIGMLGYDNYKKSYIGTWADSMGTMLITYRGVDNPEKPDETTFYGEMDDPALGAQGRMFKYHRKVINKDKFVFSMYDLSTGEGQKMMELTYTRAK